MARQILVGESSENSVLAKVAFPACLPERGFWWKIFLKFFLPILMLKISDLASGSEFFLEK